MFGPQFPLQPQRRGCPHLLPMYQLCTASKLAQARLGRWHAFVESHGSQGCRTGQTCQHTRLKKSRPRSWACLILPSGAMSVGQGVPLLSQGPLLPQCLNSCSAECPCFKMGVSLIPKGTLQSSHRATPVASIMKSQRCSGSDAGDDGNDLETFVTVWLLPRM